MVLIPSSEHWAAFGKAMLKRLGCLGRSVVPLWPAGASVAVVHGEVAWPFPTLLPQDQGSFGLQKIKFLHLGRVFKRARLPSPSVQMFPVGCSSALRRRVSPAWIAKGCLPAPFSKHPLPQNEGTFYHKWYFLDNPTKGMFDFFSSQCLAICVYFSLVTACYNFFIRPWKLSRKVDYCLFLPLLESWNPI